MAGAQETLANWTGECKPGTQARGLHGKQRCPQCGLHDTGSWDSKGAGGTPLPSCRWADSRRPAERPMGWRGQAPGRRTGGTQLSSKSQRAPACKTQASQADRPRGPALPAGTSSRSAHVLSLSPGGNETSTSRPWVHHRWQPLPVTMVTVTAALRLPTRHSSQVSLLSFQLLLQAVSRTLPVSCEEGWRLPLQPRLHPPRAPMVPPPSGSASFPLSVMSPRKGAATLP